MFHRSSCFALGLILITACASNTVLVRADDSSSEMREVQKMDCSVYDTRGEAMRAGLDFGLLFGVVRGGPYVEKAKVTGMNWDRSVHHMVAQYKELCSRFNSGGISQTAYSQRVAEIDQLWAEATALYFDGKPWWLDSVALNREAASEQSDRYEGDPWDELILKWIEDRESVSIMDVLSVCLEKKKDTWTQWDKIRVARCLREQGWKRFNAGCRGAREWRYQRSE